MTETVAPSPGRTLSAGARLGEVERRRGIDAREFHREYVRRNKPVVITGVRCWSGDEPLTPQSLRRWYGAKRLSEITPGHGALTGIAPRHLEKMPTFGDYLDRLEASQAQPAGPATPRPRGLGAMETADGLPYLTNIDLPANFPEIARHFSFGPCFGSNWLTVHRLGRRISQGELFIGPAGTTYGKLHFDRYNLYVATYQLFGKKKWWLYPPSDSRFLYPMPFGRDWYPHLSPIDQANCDLQRYPRFAQARGLSTVIEPGEVLFCPASWWHNTRNVTTSISIAVRMVNSGNVVRAVADFLLTIVISTLVERYRASVLKR